MLLDEREVLLLHLRNVEHLFKQVFTRLVEYSNNPATHHEVHSLAKDCLNLAKQAKRLWFKAITEKHERWKVEGDLTETDILEMYQNRIEAVKTIQNKVVPYN